MAFNYYVSIKGTKQGQFKGESQKSGKNDKWLSVLAFEYGVESARDAASGLPSGKRQHSPITVTKQKDGSSPQIYQASWANEILSEVVIETRPPGSEAVASRVTLTNATISKVNYAPKLPHGITKPSPKGYEGVIFEYEQIKVEGIRP
jgi:type VI secretion system secreted protein Hcp